MRKGVVSSRAKILFEKYLNLMFRVMLIAWLSLNLGM